MKLDSKVPSGALEQKWDRYRFDLKLVNPANKRHFNVLVIGTGLAGASAAATMAELGYNVDSFCFQDSPRRAHSIAAQGGINAAKNYQNDGDSVYRLFYDTIKGGDFRAREANVYRLAQISNNIIDQCVAQGVPFAREYGGLLTNRSFGGAQVSRTFYARGQTGQQLLLGAYQALSRQIAAGKVRMHSRTEILDFVLIDGKARGVITRNLVTGKIERWLGDAVVMASGGYSNVYYLSTTGMNSNVSASWRAYKHGACFANPCYVQIHPTCIPVSGDHQSKLTLMSESLRNDGRMWVPKKKGDTRHPNEIPEDERDYFMERRYPSFGNLAPRDVASRSSKDVCDAGHGVGPTGLGVYLDLLDAQKRIGREAISQKYGNLLQMYQKITDEDPYTRPLRIYPAVPYTMGGTWVDYNLMTTIPGLFCLGEANFSDHGANRLGASALMQGLSDGYFVLPMTIGGYLAGADLKDDVTTDHPAFQAAEENVRGQIEHLLTNNGSRTVDDFHRRLGKIMWEYCGIARDEEGLKKALELIPALRKEFWDDVKVGGVNENINESLEKAGRVADYLEYGELLVRDALARRESCGAHLRVDGWQSEEGEAVRDDENFAHVAAWEYPGDVDSTPIRNKEELVFENVELSTRSYK